MAKKPKTEPDNKVQSQRFVETAKKLEADKDSKAFERAFSAVVPQKKLKR